MKFKLPTLFALFALSISGKTAPQYSVVNIPPPPTKYKNFQIDGLTFLPNGKLVVCLPSGEIFFRDLTKKSWTLFAEGLHNPLGVIALSNSELIVAQRPELTRVRDIDEDGHADDFESSLIILACPVIITNLISLLLGMKMEITILPSVRVPGEMVYAQLPGDNSINGEDPGACIHPHPTAGVL